MADVINRATLEFLRSVNTPDFPEPTWKASPDMSQVAGVPPRYWKWDVANDRPAGMSQAEKDAADAADLETAKDLALKPLDANGVALWRAFALLVLDELNTHAATVTALLDAIDNASNLSSLKTAVAAITDLPQRTEAQLKAAIRGKM